MSCGWEGNRRSGIALAMRHRPEWFIDLQVQGLSKVEEHVPHQHCSCMGFDTIVMGEDGDLQFGVPYRLPPLIAPGNHAVLRPKSQLRRKRTER